MTDSDRTCPWDLLGVSPLDDAATIRKAWRALVRSYHPDLAKTDREAANRRLAEINAAFDAVCNHEAARRKLDELRRAEAAARAVALRKAEAARQAQAAREAEAARAAEQDRCERAARAAAAARIPAVRSPNWSAADLLAARTARNAFDRARRVFDGAPTPSGPAVYL